MTNEQIVKETYPNATVVYGTPYAKGWYIKDGPNMPGVSRSASAAWRKVAEHIKRTTASK